MSRHPDIRRKTIAKQILCFKNQINISEKASRQPDIRHRTRCRANIVLQKSNWYKFCPTMWWFIGGDNHLFSLDQSLVPKSWMKVDNKQTLAQTSDWKLNAWMVQLGSSKCSDPPNESGLIKYGGDQSCTMSRIWARLVYLCKNIAKCGEVG